MPKTREDIIVMKEEVHQFVLRNPEHDLYKHCTTLFEKEAILLSLGWKELCPFCPRTNGFVVEYNQAEKKNFNKGKIRARDSARETAGFPPMRKKVECTPKRNRKDTAMPDTPAKGAIAVVNLENIIHGLAVATNDNIKALGDELGGATKSNTNNIHGLIEVAKRHDEDINRNTNNIAYLAEKDKQRDHEIADIKRRIGQHSDVNDHMCRAQGKYNMRVSHELNQIRNKLGWEQADLGLEDERRGNIEDLLAESDSDFDE